MAWTLYMEAAMNTTLALQDVVRERRLKKYASSARYLKIAGDNLRKAAELAGPDDNPSLEELKRAVARAVATFS
jgi:hypothetical protein